MPSDPQKRRRRAGLIAGGIATGIGVVIAAGRAFAARDRRRADPAAAEGFGTLPGTRALAPVISFDGTSLHVEEAGSGPTVVLLHGFSLDRTTWHYQVRDLARDHRVVVYDHRGHGRSSAGGEMTLTALARDLEAVLDAVLPAGEQAVVVGHSMGGMALLEHVRLYPEAPGTRVSALVLVCTTAADVMGGMLPGAARRAQAAVQMMQEAAMRVVAGRPDRLDGLRRGIYGSQLGYLGVRLLGFGPDPSPAKVEFVERTLARSATDTWAELVPWLVSFDVSEVLPALDVPTLVVCGEHDRLTPPGGAERIAEAIPGAELATISGGAHMAMLEKPELFNARLREFLARATASRPAASRG